MGLEPTRRADRALGGPAAKLGGQSLVVQARLPAVPNKTWRWEGVTDTSATLPLDFSGVPSKVHNDMQINVSLPDGRTIVHWRRFMRLPSPAPNSSVVPVQLDHSRAGLLVGGQPFSGRGFYMQPDCPAVNCTAANGVNISVRAEPIAC